MMRLIVPAGLLILLAAVPDPVAGQEVRKLTSVRFSYPTYTPTGEILYESMADGDWDVYRMSHEGMGDSGSGIEKLTDHPGLDRMPTTSPDGRYIAFVSDRAGGYDVWRMDSDGRNPVRLTSTEEAEIHPYWTPDSRRIVFNRRIPGERLYAIWSMALDGSDPRLILQDSELNSYAQLSPDGRWLVFDKWWENEEANGEIVVLELATGEITRLTDNDVYDGYPTWAPDSRHVVYASEVDGVFKLFQIDIRTRERVQLTFGPGNDQRPDVSADGERILFNRNLDDSIEIMEMVLQDSTARLLTIGDPRISPDVLTSGRDSLQLLVRQPDGTERTVSRLDRSIAATRTDGTPTWTIVQSYTSAQGTTVDSSVVRRADLAPVTYVARLQNETHRFTFDGRDVRGTVAPADSAARSVSHSFDTAPFNAVVGEEVIRTLPLQEGFRAEFMGYNAPWPPSGSPIAVQVMGSEHVATSEGPVEAWVISMDAGGAPTTLWVAKGDRRVLRLRSELRDGAVFWRVPIEDLSAWRKQIGGAGR